MPRIRKNHQLTRSSHAGFLFFRETFPDVSQLNLILDLLGTPRIETINRIGSQRARDYIHGLPKKHKVPLKQVFPLANPTAIDLLERMLDFDPTQRITVDEALAHPYLTVYHDPSDEPIHEVPFDFRFEELETIDSLKLSILHEIAFYHPDMKSPAAWLAPSSDLLQAEETATAHVNPPDSYESSDPDGSTSPALSAGQLKSQKLSSDDSTQSPLDELEKDLAYGAQDAR
jgi:mitogen-activated protein kinase 7